MDVSHRMTTCTAFSLEKWTPDFTSSGGGSPLWIRLRCGPLELCNSLEWVEWSVNPVQVQICDACGAIDCASGGYVHLSRLRDLVLWTAPQAEPMDDWAKGQYAPLIALESLGAIAFPEQTWSALGAAASDIPGPERVEVSNWRAVAEAWALGPSRPRNLGDFPQFLQSQLMCCDSLERAEAIHWVTYWIDRFAASASQPAETLKPIGEAEACVERLYFDGPAAEDWPAFVRLGERYAPAIGGRYMVTL